MHLNSLQKVMKAGAVTVLLFAFLSSQPGATQAAPQGPTVQQLPVAIEASVAPVTATVIMPTLPPKKGEAHLLIPKLGINAAIKDMGYTDAGAMAVPDNTVDVGWFSPGTRPGDVGSAVIGAHNVWTQGDGVFIHLDQLVTGDVITVVDAEGKSIAFVVRETRTYNPTDDATAIFRSTNGIHLNLITCSGVYDPEAGTYTKRLVVFADAI